jgi:MFS transporter, DHA2 family, methylenomycin A resistance protein
MSVISVMNVSFGYLAHRWGDRRIMIVGLLIALLGTAAAALLGGSASYEGLILPIALCNAGMGLALPAITAGVMHEVGLADANVGAATLNAIRQTGGLAGVAVIGIVLHIVGNWTNDIRLSFGVFTACHVAGLLLVRWGLRRGDLAPSCGVAAPGRDDA